MATSGQLSAHAAKETASRSLVYSKVKSRGRDENSVEIHTAINTGQSQRPASRRGRVVRRMPATMMCIA